MTIADQLLLIRAGLYQWATALGGMAQICSDMHHMWMQAWVKSDTPRLLICYVGEDIRGPFSIAAATHRVDRTFNVMITRGRGFNPARGDSLVQTVGDAEPLFKLVEEVRELIRTMGGISEENPVDFKNVRSFPLGEVIIDAYVIEFSVATDLPALADVPDNYVPPI